MYIKTNLFEIIIFSIRCITKSRFLNWSYFFLILNFILIILINQNFFYFSNIWHFLLDRWCEVVTLCLAVTSIDLRGATVWMGYNRLTLEPGNTESPSLSCFLSLLLLRPLFVLDSSPFYVGWISSFWTTSFHALITGACGILYLDSDLFLCLFNFIFIRFDLRWLRIGLYDSCNYFLIVFILISLYYLFFLFFYFLSSFSVLDF